MASRKQQYIVLTLEQLEGRAHWDRNATQALHHFEALFAQGKNPTIRHNEFRDHYSVRDEDDLPFHEI